MKHATNTATKRYRRSQPEPGEMIFQTRHLRRDLHARLNILKARMTGKLPSGQKVVTLSTVLNHVLEQGLIQVEREVE